jgi:hypothetical protein
MRACMGTCGNGLPCGLIPLPAPSVVPGKLSGPLPAPWDQEMSQDLTIYP